MNPRLYSDTDLGYFLVSILPDYQIELLSRAGMVKPFDVELINPASQDVRLGTELLIEHEGKEEMKRVSIEGATKDHPWLLYPNEFVLAHTLERFQVPSNVAGQFALKSSLARAGFEHLLAGYIDPGFWDSVLTLELKNARQYRPIPLWPGMRIGQVIWSKMQTVPKKTYRETGRYNNDSTVQENKGLI